MDSFDSSKPIKQGNVDYILLFSVIALSLIGAIMVFSASYYNADKNFGNMYHFVMRHVVFTVMGYVILFVVSRVPYQNYQRFSLVIYAVSIVLLVLVLLIGATKNGASRWLFGIQPSEVAKLSLILVMADFLAKRKHALDTWFGFVLCIAVGFFPAGLVAASNLSTGLIIGCFTIGMLFVASPYIKYFIPLVIICALGVAAIILFGSEFRADRIQAWLAPERYALTTGFQTLQGLYAIGSGGVFGVGLGQSRQKFGFIPEAHNDLIFAIVCEELGAFGAGIIVLLYMILIWRCIKIAINATSMYGTLIATGVAVTIGAQVFINIGVVTNTIPNTGIPLPFISYGGTSVIILMTMIAILLNISRYYRD